MTNEEIEYIEGMVDKFVKDLRYRDDMKQEVLLAMCLQSESRIRQLRENKTMYAFVYGIIRNQYQSSTSPFYKNYKLYDIMRQSIDENYN